VESFRKELEFIKRVFSSAKTVEEYVAAAKAATLITTRCSRLLDGGRKREFAVTIRNLPTAREWGWGRLRAYLSELGITARHVDKAAGSDMAVVMLPDGEAQAAALSKLSGHVVEGQELSVAEGRPEGEEEAPRGSRGRQGGVKREAQGGAEGQRPGKAQRFNAVLPGSVCDAVCPWWQRPYRDQLTDKRDRVEEALASVTHQVGKQCGPDTAPAWLEAARLLRGVKGGSPCAPLLGILRSPVLEGYRNKAEMTVGLDQDEKAEVGYLLGNHVDGITAVADPSPARNASRLAVQYAHMMRDFIRHHSSLPAWDKRGTSNTGFWRLMVVREGRNHTFIPAPSRTDGPPEAAQPRLLQPPGGLTFQSLDAHQYLVTFKGQRACPEAEGLGGVDVAAVGEAEPQAAPPDEVVIMVQVNDTYTDAATMRRECAALHKHLRECAAAQGLPLTSLLLQLHSGCSNAAPASAPILLLPDSPEGPSKPALPGPTYMHDALCELSFRISPTAFFQVNSAAAAVLYKLAGDWVAPRSGARTLLLDICCGTGTIGITLAKRVTKVVGVDIVEESIEDAKVNSQRNGITNCQWVAGKAEAVLPDLLSQHAVSKEYDEVVAVVDPPRAGLHKDVVRALLACAPLKRIVYVSCNPESMAANLVAMCGAPGKGDRRSGGHPAQPFVPVKALAVDLFPHTKHVESVVLLERS